MRNKVIILTAFSFMLIFYSCEKNSIPKESNTYKDKETPQKENNAICNKCKEPFYYDGLGEFEDLFKDVGVEIKEDTLCAKCYEKSLIPTELEINIYNDYSKENEKRLRSDPINKVTSTEHDDSTANLLDQKIMLRWKISYERLDEIFLKVSNWAIANGFLRESIVTDKGIKSAILERNNFE